jgi:hypothetical protein
VFKRKSKQPDLDLRLDMFVTRDFVRSVVAKCHARHPHAVVTGILFFYSLSDAFLRAQFFENLDPFYSGIGYYFSEDLILPAWAEFHDRCFEVDTTVITHDGRMIHTQFEYDNEPTFIRIGSESEFNSDDESESYGCEVLSDVRKAIGQMLLAMIKQERDQGLFDPLRKTADWRIMIADDECDFEEQF